MDIHETWTGSLSEHTSYMGIGRYLYSLLFLTEQQECIIIRGRYHWKDITKNTAKWSLNA